MPGGWSSTQQPSAPARPPEVRSQEPGLLSDRATGGAAGPPAEDVLAWSRAGGCPGLGSRTGTQQTTDPSPQPTGAGGQRGTKPHMTLWSPAAEAWGGRLRRRGGCSEVRPVLGGTLPMQRRKPRKKAMCPVRTGRDRFVCSRVLVTKRNQKSPPKHRDLRLGRTALMVCLVITRVGKKQKETNGT